MSRVTFPPLDARRRALAASAVRNAERIAEGYIRVRPDLRSDLMSAAAWGLVCAAGGFDFDNPAARWAKWYPRRVRGECKEVPRSAWSTRFRPLTGEELGRIACHRSA